MNPMDGTTELIRRRIRHWKTTAAGVALILAPVLSAIFPDFADRINLAALALGGAGLISAADAPKTKN